jgi:hypothetical protein
MYPSLLIAALVASLGVAYGPGVHVREADLYVQEHPELADPELRRFVRLGAVFPDLRSGGVALPVNTHDRALGEAILAVAHADGEPWKIAFAQGYRLHTASDTVAQLLYLPWLNASSDLQQVNLFGREGLGAVGDNELFIEGYGDLHTGDLQAFVDTAYAFLFDAPGELEEVVELFMAGLAAVAGDELDDVAARASIDAFWFSVESTLSGLDPGFVASLLAESHTLTVSEVIALLSSGLFADLLGSVPGSDGQLQADPHEMARLELHPAGATPGAFFGAYESIFASAAFTILEDPGYASWPWYREAPIVAGIVQGFALGRPDVWSHRPEVLLWGARFEDEEGAPLASLTGGGQVTVRATSELFRAFPGAPVAVSLEVVPRQGGGLSATPSQEVIASATEWVAYGAERATLSVEFTLDTEAAAVEGYAMRWRVEGDPLPFLETDWARYSVLADAPLFRPSYAQDVAATLPTLSVHRATPEGALGWILGHVVLPQGHRGLAASVRDALSGSGGGHSHAGGGFVIGGLAAGPRSLIAEAHGYRGGPVSVTVASGEPSACRIDLRAVPKVSSPAWSPFPGRLNLGLDVQHFSAAPAQIAITLTRADDEVTVGTWEGAPLEGVVTVMFVEPQADGASIVVSTQADEEQFAASATVRIDATAPSAPVLSWSGAECIGPFEIGLEAEDSDAPVSGYEVSSDGDLWHAIGSAGEAVIAVEVKPGRAVVVMARAQNAAGLWSEVTEALLCTPADERRHAPGDSQLEDVGDVSSDAVAPEGRGPGALAVDAPGPQEGEEVQEDGCAGGGRHGRGGWAWVLLLLAQWTRSGFRLLERA